MCTTSPAVQRLHIKGRVLTTYRLDNIDLGTACGKFFRVGCLSITDAGDSDIIQDVTGSTDA